MKAINYFLSLCFILVSASFQAQAQSGEDSTGLPGDNFDLQGALQMFQNASSPEEFEKAINTEGNYVNNLDLDGDGDIDYVRVTEKTEKDLHVFVLQVPVSSTETQDIATIEIEKTGKESAVIQIIGDEDIYGEEIIVEPDGGGNDGAFIDNSNNNNFHGPYNNFDNAVPAVVVNVWLWPSVRYVYAPAYRPWISPWRWHAYPGWWKPWRPFAYHVWHPYRAHYHRPFVVVHTNRVMHAHSFYKPYRSTSVIVSNRHSASVNNYRVTRSRTTVTGPKGKKTTVKKTTVTGPRGNKASKVKVRRH
jgi:hypothetical protein